MCSQLFCNLNIGSSSRDYISVQSFECPSPLCGHKSHRFVLSFERGEHLRSDWIQLIATVIEQSIISHIIRKNGFIIVYSKVYNYSVDFFLSQGQLEQVHLSAPSVVVKNKAVSLTTVLRPSNVGTVSYYWWFNNKTEVSFTYSSSSVACWLNGTVTAHLSRLFVFQPVVTLVGVKSFTFSEEGSHTVTVQAAVGNIVHEDQITLAVYGELNTQRSSKYNYKWTINYGVHAVYSYWEGINTRFESCFLPAL